MSQLLGTGDVLIAAQKNGQLLTVTHQTAWGKRPPNRNRWSECQARGRSSRAHLSLVGGATGHSLTLRELETWPCLKAYFTILTSILEYYSEVTHTFAKTPRTNLRGFRLPI